MFNKYFLIKRIRLLLLLRSIDYTFFCCSSVTFELISTFYQKRKKNVEFRLNCLREHVYKWKCIAYNVYFGKVYYFFFLSQLKVFSSVFLFKIFNCAYNFLNININKLIATDLYIHQKQQQMKTERTRKPKVFINLFSISDKCFITK